MRLKVQILRMPRSMNESLALRVKRVLYPALDIMVSWFMIQGAEVALRNYVQTGNMSSFITAFCVAMTTLAMNAGLIYVLGALRR